MTRDKINEAIGKCRQYLWNMSIPAEQQPSERLIASPEHRLKHCMWMCDQSFKLSDDKAMRWLCFIQGVLWDQCLKTIEDFKEMNRADQARDNGS